jgi:hypothetical protein
LCAVSARCCGDEAEVRAELGAREADVIEQDVDVRIAHRVLGHFRHRPRGVAADRHQHDHQPSRFAASHEAAAGSDRNGKLLLGGPPGPGRAPGTGVGPPVQRTPAILFLVRHLLELRGRLGGQRIEGSPPG